MPIHVPLKLSSQARTRSWSFLLLAAVTWTGCQGCRDASPPAREPAAQAEWPQWRGPSGMGLAPEQPLPEQWSAESPNVLWRTDVPGTGNSSPIVSGGRVFLTTAIEEEEEGRAPVRRVAVAFDFETGKLLWETPVSTSPREKRHSLNTTASPTPATDGEHVFVYFGSILAALDVEGRIAWENEVDPNYAKYSRYAASSSPVLLGDKVVVVQDREWADTEDVGWIAAFDKGSGQELWRQTWDNTCCSYSTPLVYDQEPGLRRLLFAHSGSVSEYDADTGEKLWMHAVPINQMVSSLVAEGDLLCIAGGAHNVRAASCVRLRGRGKETQVETLWETNQGAPETSSPVLYDGKLFMVTSRGVVNCVDPQTGERLWRQRLEQSKNYLSLVAGDGKVYVASAAGRTSVLGLQPKIGVIAVNDLDQGGTASPAVADGSLVIRTKSQLLRIGRTQR